MTSPFPTTYTSSELLYVAFRAAFLTTFQDLLDEFEPYHIPGSSSGFLAQASIAAGCASQVQLDVLFRTWQRIDSGHETLTALEQCVCFYAIGELARLGKADDRYVIDRAANGPRVVACEDLTWLASTLRTIQITWPFPVDAADLELEMNEMVDNSDRRVENNTNQSLADEFLELLSHWTVSTQILQNAEGLLTPRESSRLGKFFSKHSQLMNL